MGETNLLQNGTKKDTNEHKNKKVQGSKSCFNLMPICLGLSVLHVAAQYESHVKLVKKTNKKNIYYKTYKLQFFIRIYS